MGYLRLSGKSWAWNDLKTGQRLYADNRLHSILHNPFYAGWVVSEKFGVRIGEVKGQWEPIITPEEYNRGLEILHVHDAEKSRFRKHFYLLRFILWVKENNALFRLYVSTPKGRSKSYPYYISQAKPAGKAIHIPCETVDSQIPDWLSGIRVDPELLPAIRKVYHSQVKEVTDHDHDTKLVELKRQISKLQEEEARLGRLLITDKISQETYEKLRKEWQEKQRHIEMSIADLKRETFTYLDDLEVALLLMTKLSILFHRLAEKDRAILLQILAKRIIVDPLGEIIDHQLNTPFAYLRNIVDEIQLLNIELCGSDQVNLGAHADADHHGVFHFWPSHPIEGCYAKAKTGVRTYWKSLAVFPLHHLFNREIVDLKAPITRPKVINRLRTAKCRIDLGAKRRDRIPSF